MEFDCSDAAIKRSALIVVPPRGYALALMDQPGRYKVASRNRALEAYLDPAVRSARRVRRILDSLRDEIGGGETDVRVRRIFVRPREIFRLEIESLEFGYQRTTLLDREALELLLEAEEVRSRLRIAEEPCGRNGLGE